jgi:putative membrane protein
MTDYYSVLPHLNATLNASSFVLLSSGYYFIRQKRVLAHRNCQIAALTASVLFLVSYVVYHAHHGTTRFTGQGIARPIYFTILTTHTFLAVVIVPLVIITVRRAWRGDFLRHKAIARWTLPLWLYVSITGVVVYLMLYHLYPSR